MDTPDDFTGPINIGNPQEFTMRELAHEVLRLTGSKSQLVQRLLPADDPKQRRPDIKLAQTMLEWNPTVALPQGLEKTIAYFRGLAAGSA
jgi:UDP-glucuronate decarboxylase